MSKEFEKLSSLVAFIPTGSRVICDPPVMNTDEDWVLLVSDWRKEKVVTELGTLGYLYTGNSSYQQDPFNAGIATFRKNEENLIVTFDMQTFVKWKTATKLAKQFNLTNKQDRVDLFTAIKVNG